MSRQSVQRVKAVVAREIGKPPAVEEIEVDAPRHGEVTVRLAACGVCHSDLSATNGTISYPLPLVLGHEGAGVVTAVGEGVSRYAVGDHVVSSFVSMRPLPLLPDRRRRRPSPTWLPAARAAG
jgi:Zn-dependent alcohol dehydrogenase